MTNFRYLVEHWIGPGNYSTVLSGTIRAKNIYSARRAMRWEAWGWARANHKLLFPEPPTEGRSLRAAMLNITVCSPTGRRIKSATLYLSPQPYCPDGRPHILEAHGRRGTRCIQCGLVEERQQGGGAPIYYRVPAPAEEVAS
jgi:hypothetical protein